MKRGLLLTFMVVFLVGCTQTEIVTEPIEVPVEDEESTEEVTEEPAAEDTGETMEAKKVATSCEDSDGNDINEGGKVTITYSDGTTEEFFDECPGDANFQTEYICDGNNLATQNTICDNTCVVGVCI